MRRCLLHAARAAAPLAVLALAACERGGPAGDSLFPLDAGHVWTYRVTTTPENGDQAREQLTMRTTGRESLDGQPAWRRRSESGMDYWLREDASGIYRVASKSDLEAEPRPDAERRYVLRAPYTVGTSWQSTTTPYLLQRRHEFPRELRHSHPAVPMNYTIEATDEVLETGAGRFEHCLRVRGDASLRLYADAVSGWRNVPLTTLEWYCPGVGLARLERQEPPVSAFIEGGSLTMELTGYTSGR